MEPESQPGERCLRQRRGAVRAEGGGHSDGVRRGLPKGRSVSDGHAIGRRFLVRAQPGAQVPPIFPKRFSVRSCPVDFLRRHVLGGPGTDSGRRKRKESIPMKQTIALLIGSPGALCAAAMTVATLYDSQLKMVESEVVSLAEAMPESAYNFAPTQGAFEKVRTFGEQVKHIAAVNYMAGAAAAKEKPPVDPGTGENGPDSVKTK